MAEIGSNGTGAGTDIVPKIIKQIEYYFGDMNLMKDKFLKDKMQEDDGWITIETMLRFNRLKLITEDCQVVCDAIRQSKSGLMEVSDKGDKIRRNPDRPLPGDSKERRDEVTGRSVYAKAFPLDINLDELQEFFEAYGTVENVFMKKDFHKKSFKGSVFVTFANKVDAEKFVQEEDTKYKDTPLEAKYFKTDYYKSKATQKKERSKKTKDVKTTDQEKETKDQGKNNSEISEHAQEDLEQVKQQMTKNAVLHLRGIKPETTREQIKKFFSAHGEVGWVDFDKGVTEGYIRLREPNSAGPTLEKAKATNDGKIVIEESEVEVRVVEGDEELQYWKKMFKDIAEKKKNGGRDRKGGRYQRGGRNQRGGRRNRGGPQGKRKHKGESDDENSCGMEDRDDEEPQAKVSKNKTDTAE